MSRRSPAVLAVVALTGALIAGTSPSPAMAVAEPATCFTALPVTVGGAAVTPVVTRCVPTP